MTDIFYSEKLHDGSWIFATVLDVISCSNYMTNNQLSELLIEFGEPGCSYEVIFESAIDDKVRCSFLIRKSGMELEWIQDTFEGFIKTLIDRLEYEGFQIARKNKHEVEALFDGLNARKQVYICIPGTDACNSGLCYVPGGYMCVDSLDFAYIMSVLKKSQSAGISFQLNSTILLDVERQRITENIDWLRRTYGNMQEAQRAIDRFQFYLNMEKERNFYLCLCYWGNEEALDKLSHSICHKGYRIHKIPSEVLYKRNYLLEGSRILPQYSTAMGHELHTRCVIPQGLERLGYLVPAFVVGKLVNLDEFVKKADCNCKEDVVQVPEVFLSNDGLEIGNVIDTEEQLYVPLQQLTKHMTIAGMSGFGKTTLLFKILLECNKKNIPFLIIEPTKTEHRELLDSIPDLKVFTPGKTSVSPIMFNPFLPPKNVTLEQFLPNLISSFQLAFSMTTPLDVIFSEAVRNCYAKYGWRNDSMRDSFGVTHFGMHEFICAFKEEINNSSYDFESKQNLNSGGVYRLQSLINNNSYLFDTDKTVDFEKLLCGCTLIELDAIDNREQKALFMSMLLLQLKLVIRQTQKKDSRLKNIILIDEAHVLLDNSNVVINKNEANPDGKIEDYLLEMVKINRVYGTGMIFADQSLAIMKSFVNNSNIKVAMHLEAHEEREFLMNNLNLSEDMYKAIANLKVGQFYISCELLEKPLLVRLEDVRKSYQIPCDVGDEYVVARMGAICQKPFLACFCKKECDNNIRNEADFIARNVCNKYSSAMHISGELNTKTQIEIDELICQMAAGYESEEKLIRCAKIMTGRMLRRKATMVDE